MKWYEIDATWCNMKPCYNAKHQCRSRRIKRRCAIWCTRWQSILAWGWQITLCQSPSFMLGREKERFGEALWWTAAGNISCISVWQVVSTMIVEYHCRFGNRIDWIVGLSCWMYQLLLVTLILPARPQQTELASMLPFFILWGGCFPTLFCVQLSGRI